MSIEAPEPRRFDLKAALANRSHATETVTVFLDEGLMYEYAKVARESDLDPANEEKRKARDEMLKTFEGIALKVTVKSIPIEQDEIVIQEILEKYPPKYFLDQPLPNREADTELNIKLWTLAVVKIEAPDGASITPDESDIRALRDQAPRVTLDVIANAIKNLNEATRSGYDTIVKDPDFLSRPSLTA